MTEQVDWSISRSWPIEPPSGAGHDAAYKVRLTDAAGETHDLIVEFVAPSSLTSVGYAEEIARKVRGRAELPLHVIVARDGAVELAGDAPPRG